MKNYNIFVKEFNYWKDKLQLNSIGIEFQIKKNHSEMFASISIDADCMKAAVRFYINENKEQTVKQIKHTAKHECMHLLIGRLSYLSHQRYVRGVELNSAEEELVQRLLKIIK